MATKLYKILCITSILSLLLVSGFGEDEPSECPAGEYEDDDSEISNNFQTGNNAAPAQTNPSPAQTNPAPAPAQTKPAPAPAPAQTKAAPDPSPAQTKPAPAPAQTKPAPAQTKAAPDPSPAQTKPAPAPAQTKPAPAQTKAAPAQTKAAPAQANPAPVQTNAATAQTNAATGFLGQWELMPGNPGISAMHTVVLPVVNKIAIFDATVWQISRLQLPPEKRPCPTHQNKNTGVISEDCWAHSVFYDFNTNQASALRVETDTWCSSGGLSVDGRLVSTGGYQLGSRTTRYLWSCPTCDWIEYPTALADGRWYATQVTLPDGNFLVFGGRDSYSYEYIPMEKESNKAAIPFPFLLETKEWYQRPGHAMGDFRLENNLYPFVYLLPDGNIYVFANTRSILLDIKTNSIIREYPQLPGGGRNYPATGTSVLLPLYVPREPNNNNNNNIPVDAEVLICGGSVRDAYYFAEVEKKLIPALDDCARMVVTSPDPVWKIEKMPTPRVMADGLLLPNGDVLILNGAEIGSAGWHCADKPSLKPLLYKPTAPEGQRFTELAPTGIPRMYHSVANLLPDGKVFVAGSNDNDGYDDFAKFPTELRVEKFSPPYLAPELAPRRVTILEDESEKVVPYGKHVSLKIKSPEMLTIDDLAVSIIAPPFSTHSMSMNQRLLMLPVLEVKTNVAPQVHELTVVAPASGSLAPPGYFMLSVLNNGIPSPSMWFQIK